MLKIMRDFLDAPKVEEGEAPQAVTGWNIKPTQQVRVGYLHEDGAVATTARWWFVPHWHKGEAGDWKATTFNAKVETAREKPTFRIAWTSGRCIIPAIGYYEWTGSKGKKQPWFIRPETNTDLFFFAGLMSRLPKPRKLLSFCRQDRASGVICRWRYRGPCSGIWRKKPQCRLSAISTMQPALRSAWQALIMGFPR